MAAPSVTATLTQWYAENARELPWRSTGVTPWGVLVSEFMLQQTPAARVIPAWEQWIATWPTPGALAADSPGAAVRAWGRLGYPRRALRLHGSAVAIVERHGGEVPSSFAELLALPGVGTYTASAIATFGFGQRHAVLDTNVRRVLARYVDGRSDASEAAPSKAERAAALALVPEREPARYSVAVMELGALVCTARNPRCDSCPLSATCAWHRSGRPDSGRRRPAPTYAGTDRQARGQLLAVVRDGASAVDQSALDAAWDDKVQRTRALAGLLADGLIQVDAAGRYRLPA
jgi:A/G-specific adenine glycosylase